MAVPVSGPDGVARPNSSGIKVIVVGLGVAGLAAAIECHRKGHTVIAFEKVKEMKPLGDVIAISSNAARVIDKWGGGSVHEALYSVTSDLNPAGLYDETGSLKLKSAVPGFRKGEGYLLSRGDLAVTFFEHAKSLNIDIRMGICVTEFWETDTSAGVIVDGEKIEADCVIASDGVHSKARVPITGETPRIMSSGRAIYRAWCDASVLEVDPKTKWLTESGSDGGDDSHVFMAKDVTMVMSTTKNHSLINWSCFHLDSRGATDLFYYPATADQVLEYIKVWPVREKLESVIRRTPPDNLIDYPLVTFEPAKNWVSKGGRMILIGDASHPFLPTSGQGACQGIEDGAVVAIALELAEKGNIRQALEVTNKIYRRERTVQIYNLGLFALETVSNPDWSEAEKNSKLFAIPNPEWVLNHNCQKSAYDEYHKIAESIANGTEYTPQNIPSSAVRS
ncbi:putative salicylate hydroxylase protein [Trichophyton interdigitale]|uniref:FAD binding domain-containing protein n=2 Tax=Trichophyton interdigitale TaxID=101480 RepID=A0A9P5CZ45_9EURO|nr:hypothetical protein H101_02935 [Trichophyton interdigitale H6]KAF3893973.1 FAD binding domain-containing protein [Trichophyton interdigitale]KAF3896031.1 FAD binding domain-containing protein [Trichophyton interdigitale]KAG8209118.1 putative salicylate hydroxylase protein [Trichophyton interdigitale]KDB26642.1 hypothetical protein H109_01549 [Trichophyton interdigitale MR816]